MSKAQTEANNDIVHKHHMLRKCTTGPFPKKRAS